MSRGTSPRDAAGCADNQNASRQAAEIAASFRLRKLKKMPRYQAVGWWLLWQSAANASLHAFPCEQAKLQGNPPNWGTRSISRVDKYQFLRVFLKEFPTGKKREISQTDQGREPSKTPRFVAGTSFLPASSKAFSRIYPDEIRIFVNFRDLFFELPDKSLTQRGGPDPMSRRLTAKLSGRIVPHL